MNKSLLPRRFSELGEKQKDGSVPMSEIFDAAFYDVYRSESSGKLCSMVGCYKGDGYWQFDVSDEEDNEYRIIVSENWNINFFCNGGALHFNHWVVYKKLIEFNFL